MQPADGAVLLHVPDGEPDTGQPMSDQSERAHQQEEDGRARTQSNGPVYVPLAPDAEDAPSWAARWGWSAESAKIDNKTNKMTDL